MAGLAFIVAVVAVVLAVVFWFQRASAVEALGALRADAEGARKEAEAARSDLRKQHEELKSRSAQLQEPREELKKFKGGAETNNRVYLVTKGELELTKERLAQAERKLWQAGTPLAPPAQKERPKGKGPAAAERPRESAAQAGSEEGSLDGASAEAEAAGEPIAAAEIE